MMPSIGEKIEAIRKEPETVRMRYVVGSVSVAMIFIIGIWLLSVHESFTKTAEDLPRAVEQGKEEMLGGKSVPSLNDLFEQSAPLRIEDQGVEGSQFFDQQVTGRENAAGEGGAPQLQNQ